MPAIDIIMAKKKNNIFRITGRIIDCTTRQGVQGLQIEGWDKDLIFNDLVGSAMTDSEGRFQITFTKSYFEELFSDRQPDLFFKVFNEDELIMSTEDYILWNVAAGDTEISIEVDIPATIKLNGAFVVRGKISDAGDNLLVGVVVKAFDKDLRSEEELGKTNTNKDGEYEIYYSAQKFRRAEKVNADLVIKVFAADDSLLAASSVLFNAPLLAEVDLTIPTENWLPPTLFEKIERALIPLLEGLRVEELEEGKQYQDLTFLSGETAFEKNVLARFALVHKLAENCIQPEFWFALLDGSFFQYNENKNLEEQLVAIIDSLPSLDAAAVRKKLTRAFNQKEIPEAFREKIDNWVDEFLKFVASRLVSGGPTPTFVKLALDHAGIEGAEKQELFARLFNEHKTLTPELLAVLEKDKSFNKTEIADLSTTFLLADLTRGDFSVVKMLKEEFDVRQPEKIRTLAKKSEREWVNLVVEKHTAGEIKLPIEAGEIAGQMAFSAAEVYGKTLERQFREAFPTTAFAGGLERALQNGGAHGLRHAKALGEFLERYENFELLNTPVDDFLKKNIDLDFQKLAKNESFRLEVKAVQRVFKLAPTFEATDALLADDLHSAQKVYRMGETQFVRRYAGRNGFTLESAQLAWNRAADTYAAVLTIVADLKALEEEGLPFALKSGSIALSNFPNWNNLFKTGDRCECEHCRSVLGPAAYFADLLVFLKDRYWNGVSLKDILFRRRADLGYLELNCDNAMTHLPYIDVVCEVLEEAVAGMENDIELPHFVAIPAAPLDARRVVLDSFQRQGIRLGADFSLSQVNPGDPDRWVAHGDDVTYLLKKKPPSNFFFAKILPNTKASAAELRAYPQYVNPKAYEKLRAAKYPLILPFDLFTEEVRAAFQKTNLHRWDLMRVLRGGTAPNNPTDLEIAAEYFGISISTKPADPSEKELILVADATDAGQKAVWGETASNWLPAVSNVKKFLQKTGLGYTELLALIDLKFINPTGKIYIDHSDDTGCDIGKQDIKGLDKVKLDRIHRFLRLWRKLKGWKIWELDLVIRHPVIGSGKINDSFLIALYYFSELKNKLGNKTTVEQTLALFGNLSTETYFTELHKKRVDGLYQNLFLNKKLTWPLDTAFDIDSATGDVLPGETLTAYLPAMQAALGMREADLLNLMGLKKPSDGLAYIPDVLNLANLSFLWRHAFLIKTLKFKMEEWTTVLKLFNQDVGAFTDSQAAWYFLEKITWLKNTGFSVDELNWVLSADRSAKTAVKEDDATRFLFGLHKELQAIQNENDPLQFDFLQASPPTSEEPLAALLTTLLQQLGRNEAGVNFFLATLQDLSTETSVKGLPAGFTFPAAITRAPNFIPIRYDEPSQMFVFVGEMTPAQRDILLNDPSMAAVTIMEAPVAGLPLGFLFPQAITGAPNDIPIFYDEPNLVLRFNGVITAAQRTILLTDPSLAAVTGIPAYLAAVNTLFNQPTVINAYQTAINALVDKRRLAVVEVPVAGLPLGFSFPLSIIAAPNYIPIRYDESNPATMLRFNGVMTLTQRSTLLNDPSLAAVAGIASYQAAINALFDQPRLAVKFYETVFSVPLDILPPAVDFKTQLPGDVSAKISYDSEQRLLRFNGTMSPGEKAALDLLSLDPAWLAALNSLASQPSAVVALDPRIWLNAADLDPTVQANDTFAKRMAIAITRALVFLSKTLSEKAVVQQCSEVLGLQESIVREIVTHFQLIPPNTVIAFFTGTFATTNGAIDYTNFKNAFDIWFWLNRVAVIVKKWKVTLEELERLILMQAPAQLLDFKNLPLDSAAPVASIDNFLRTSRLLRLRDTLPETGISLLEVLEKLMTGSYATAASFAADTQLLNEAWLADDVEAFVASLDIAYPAGYLLAESWERLHRAFRFLDNLNASANTVKKFAAPAMTDAYAKTLKELLRSKFGVETWLTLSAEIQDTLRERKRNALAAFLLTQAKPSDAPSGKWENMNDLYAYYLLDLEMSSCQLTSRLVQGAGSIQLFVQRCFMGLEPEVVVEANGVNGDSAWHWWKWMRKYRVWEANRKVFLWPENWIEPELKKDRSPFFKDMENELLQNEVNQYTVETAFSNYLEKLSGVAQLEIAGFYQEDNGDNTIIHVFARTQGAEPHLYYYRRYDYHQWTPWEKVELDIQGDYLIPAVVNSRLFLFWPVFTEVPDETGNTTIKMPTPGQATFTPDKTKKRLRMQMATSEYRQGKWTPKRVSKNFAESDENPERWPNVSHSYTGEIISKYYRFFPIDRSDLDGRFYIMYEGWSYDNSPNWRKAWLKGEIEFSACNGAGDFTFFPGYPSSSSAYHTTRPEEASRGFSVTINGKDSVLHDTVSLKWVELTNRTDSPADDFTLDTYTGLSNSRSEVILANTPGAFKMSPAWQYSYMDKLSERVGVRYAYSPVLAGTWLPFFYNDKLRTFFVQPSYKNPMISPSQSYYPEIKNYLRSLEAFFGGPAGTWVDSFVYNLTPAQRDGVIQWLVWQYQLTWQASYTDVELKDLVKRYPQEAVYEYLRTLYDEWLRSQQFHFKNFYHPFVCDFAKLITNPLKGIPGLMSRETQLKNTGFNFKNVYQPTAHVVQAGTEAFYPKEIVDFAPEAAYSSYNWELFFHAPLLIANSLSKNQRFEEARDWYHFIFNPIGVESAMPGGSRMSKYWITKPFFETTDPQYLQQRIDNILLILAGDRSVPGYHQVAGAIHQSLFDWRTNPFEPHRIANYRTVAYQKTVVMKYLDNLIAWGDNLFRQDSMESINEATQLYILAAELLGPRPKTIPPRAKPPLESFNELEYSEPNGFDSFSNALVQAENLIPVLPGNGSIGANQPPLPMLYFCIPQNEKLLGYWDTVADRLYKIRHCMNIEGVVRQLALFEPPIDPAALVKAVSGGADLSSALNDLNAPLPLYRFNVLLQKANEVCNDLKALGGALLSALEKKDAEAIGMLRQGQEIRLLEAVKTVREKQIEEAKENLEGVRKSKELITIRRNYYQNIEKISPSETLHQNKLAQALIAQQVAQSINIGASVAHLIPDVKAGVAGFGGTPTAQFSFGGSQLGASLQAVAGGFTVWANAENYHANKASINAGHDRRWDDWKLQERLAEKELEQVDKSITSAELRIAMAEKELNNHLIQIENAKATDEFMRSKYTNSELYQWQVGQISGVYFQSYKLAYDLAKRAERCFRFELGLVDSSYLSFGYWDSLKKGLLSGEKLQYDLRRLETAYLEQNRREFELTKHVSLALLDPLALVKLRETGRCFFNLPEEIFDLDYPGHYFRRLKSVSLTLPCIAGPYTTIACTLRLLKNQIRTKTDLNDGYAHAVDVTGAPAEDPRFAESNIPVKAIATSTGQNDSGMFELSFRDERYLPFEGAGAISQWSLELFNDNATDFGKALRQFDYATISEAVLHMKYTAREDAGLFKSAAVTHLREYFEMGDTTPSIRLFNLRQEFPTQWNHFLHPMNLVNGNVFDLEMKAELFPFRDAGKALKVNSITLLARCMDGGDYTIVIEPPLPAPPPAGSNSFILAKVNEYGGLHFAKKGQANVPPFGGVTIDPAAPTVKWQLKMTRPGGGNLQENLMKKVMEVEDLLLVLEYEWV